MTRFEEIMDNVIKNKKGKKDKTKKDTDVCVPGLTSDENEGNPRMDFANEEQDPSMTDMLYRDPRSAIRRGETASYWDSE